MRVLIMMCCLSLLCGCAGKQEFVPVKLPKPALIRECRQSSPPFTKLPTRKPLKPAEIAGQWMKAKRLYRSEVRRYRICRHFVQRHMKE
ncbi:MAG: hypothetical protein ACRBBN_15115 [Methyloligellaceae bacterium]